MEETAIALRALIKAAKAQPENAALLWQAARILLNSPAAKQITPALPGKDRESEENAEFEQSFPALKAEFDYLDDNGLCSHRTVWVLAVTDGRDIKRNVNLPVADRYGYLLTGYCTLRKQIRSFRSSRISNLRTFTEGAPREPNRQWRPRVPAMAS